MGGLTKSRAHVTLADNLTDTQITNIQEECKARKMVWDSQSNVNRAIISGLNLAVPCTYCRAVAGAVGTRNYMFTDDPKVILQGLQDNYGQMTPAEETKMEADWSAAWNPSEPIKLLFDRLEDCYVLSVAGKNGIHTGADDIKGTHRDSAHGTISHRNFGIPSFPHGKQKLGWIQKQLL